jgi:hypothetical protein
MHRNGAAIALPLALELDLEVSLELGAKIRNPFET